MPHEQGIKFDKGKPDWSLLPPDPLEEIIRVYEHGVRAYARDNWRKGFKYSRIFAATMRHLWKWWRGADRNPEDSNVKHLAQAAWGCLTLLEYTKNSKYSLFDDRLVEDGAPVNNESDVLSIPFIQEPGIDEVTYTVSCTPPPPKGEVWVVNLATGTLEIRKVHLPDKMKIT